VLYFILWSLNRYSPYLLTTEAEKRGFSIRTMF